MRDHDTSPWLTAILDRLDRIESWQGAHEHLHDGETEALRTEGLRWGLGENRPVPDALGAALKVGDTVLLEHGGRLMRGSIQVLNRHQAEVLVAGLPCMRSPQQLVLCPKER